MYKCAREGGGSSSAAQSRFSNSKIEKSERGWGVGSSICTVVEGKEREGGIFFSLSLSFSRGVSFS